MIITQKCTLFNIYFLSFMQLFNVFFALSGHFSTFVFTPKSVADANYRKPSSDFHSLENQRGVAFLIVNRAPDSG